ncbi:unnamed protein product [Paramecium pentaurelia]|uniref:H-type lectin domain-containing protein n=1 Tax=Paramecium pentaurelia TaxID=43138 RepID=A0A8S1Y2Z9_9CILI|nr:unnamed protein product [Paramecium pentaurelia]
MKFSTFSPEVDLENYNYSYNFGFIYIHIIEIQKTQRYHSYKNFSIKLSHCHKEEQIFFRQLIVFISESLIDFYKTYLLTFGFFKNMHPIEYKKLYFNFMKVYLIIHIVCGIITYDSNTITNFAYQYSGGSKCISPQQRQKTVYFSDIFARPPKIILQTQMFDLEHPYLNFTLQIMTVTTDYFILHQKCDYSVVHGIVIRWQAMDDERIQVINEFNMISLQNKTYSHNNPNVEEAIISLINLSYKGSIKFNIEIAELTTKNVSVVITNPNDGLKNLLVLGYQVILGVKEAISHFSSIYTTAAYTSPHYNFKDSSWLITPFIGFSYDVTANIRLNLTHYTDQQAIWYN